MPREKSGGRKRRTAVPEWMDTGTERRKLSQTQSRQLSVYPLPDASVSQDALAVVGYRMDDLLPLSVSRACELMEQGMTVYVVQTGENPAVAFDRNDILDQPEGTVFAVLREEWETSTEIYQTAGPTTSFGMEANAYGG